MQNKSPLPKLVPNFILDQFQAGNQQGSIPGAGMFVDLSGFSAMSDALSKHGYAGSEVLASMMQAVFEPLVDAVYAQNGFVVGYIGDAVSVIFPEQDGQSPAALRCLAAAQLIRAHFLARPLMPTSMGEFAISVKIGLALGESIWEIFRSINNDRASYCFRGPGMDNSARAEHQAVPGEIWLDAAMAGAVRDYISGPVRDGYTRVDTCSLHLPLPARLPQAEPDRQAMLAFFSSQILDLNARGEFRPLVNVFIDIPEQIQQGEGLQAFMQHIFILQALYGGFFLRLDFGDKGCNLLLFWGAPVAYENDIQRALNFLLDLQRESGLRFSAGVSYRMAYAGFIGSALRQDYTGYGWGISLAARMMKAAKPGEIWVDDEVARRVSHEYDFNQPEERSFKGFATPQKVHLLTHRKDASEQVYRLPFEGRQAELEQLTEFLSPLSAGRFAGSCILIGDAGVGKSRLLSQLQQSPALANVRWALCQTDEIIREAFNPLRYWLRGYFGVSEQFDDAQNWALVEQAIQRLARHTADDSLRSELLRTTSFIAALLNLYSPDSLYSQLDARGRYENTFLALEALFCAESVQAPLVLLIEDTHVLDVATRDFLAEFQHTLQADSAGAFPIAILATSRPEGESYPDPSRVIHLTGLDAQALARLSESVLGSPASPELIALLQQRAEANPFFVEQVLQYLKESNSLELRGNQFALVGQQQAALVSTDIHSILVSRLDRLTRDLREIVLSAAVLGREFELRLLLRMLNAPGLSEAVHTTQAEEIWLPLNEIRYIFRHALLRDAAYSMQLRSRQRELHALALAAMEELYRDDLQAHYGELAHHAEQASNQSRACQYLLLAARQSQESYQLAQARAYAERGLHFLSRQDQLTRYQLLKVLNSVFSAIGETKLQQETLDEMALLANQLADEALRLEVESLRITFHHSRGNWQEVLDLAAKYSAEAAFLNDRQILVDINISVTQALLRLGRLDEALVIGTENAELARAGGLAKYLPGIFNGLGLVCTERFERQPAQEYFMQALELARESKDLYIEAQAINNLGNLAAQTADYVSAREYYQLALELARRMGNRPGQSLVLGNLGWISALLGDFSAASEYQQQALAIAREVGNLYVVGNSLVNLSSLAGYLGHAEDALLYANQGMEVARALNDRSTEAWAYLFRGYAYLLERNYPAGREDFNRCAEIRLELGQPNLRLEPLTGLVQTCLEQANLPDAIRIVNEILSALDSGMTLDGTEEPLRVYYYCYAALAAAGDDRAGRILQAGVGALEEGIKGIDDEKTRRMVVENVPWRRALLQAWEGRGG